MHGTSLSVGKWLPESMVIAALAILILAGSLNPLAALAQASTVVKENPLRDAYYADLHLHTDYSIDAYLGVAAKIDPDQAYRFAKGEAVDYLGERVRRRWQLDFLAVTDHSENLGVLSTLDDPNSDVSRSELGKRAREIVAMLVGPDGLPDGDAHRLTPAQLGQYAEFFRDYLGFRRKPPPDDLRVISSAAWAREIAFANQNYEPGRFTTFIAYEWTSAPNGSNLHRNLIFKGNTAPDPFTSYDSREPEDLWDWLDAIRKQGFEALAIPHNGNASNGLMYDWVDSISDHLGRAYAQQRQANEPLSEIAQSKGTSETHPLLSPDDEFADYESFDHMVGSRLHAGRPQGSYLRDALSRGLVMQRQMGVNPFKYGFVGGTDQHSGLSISDQADYAGDTRAVNVGNKGRARAAETYRNRSAASRAGVINTTAGSLTGVWAESNTRESIYSALRRRETFATSGTRLKLRFFGSWKFAPQFLQQKNWISNAYAIGAPMGADLPPAPGAGQAPIFAIWAVKDPNGANLDRAQVIKVWEQDGQQKERVFDVAWSGSRRLDPQTGKLPPVGNTVDLNTGQYTNRIGAVELKTVWRDPDFDPKRFASYYLRALEIPSPRWSTLLAIENHLPLPQDVPLTQQQRAWCSPIWYSPPNEPKN